MFMFEFLLCGLAILVLMLLLAPEKCLFFLETKKPVKNKKVYCKNCKYYFYDVRFYFPRDHIWNACKKVSQVVINGIGDLVYREKADASIQNKNCNCKHYKKLWYKFWVR